MNKVHNQNINRLVVNNFLDRTKLSKTKVAKESNLSREHFSKWLCGTYDVKDVTLGNIMCAVKVLEQRERERREDMLKKYIER